MPDGAETAIVEVTDRIASVAAAEWDACAGADNPFLAHAFLEALEASGSATGEEGWLPQHLLLREAGGRLVGAVPLYLKSHSYGEYVFDHGWADAYERAGGSYYPKLQCAVPFTPVPGPRLLVRPGADGERVRATLVAGLTTLARRLKVSSVHVTFPTEAEWRLLGESGFLLREGTQFHWENLGYASFEDFLGALASRKRKAIRKERRQVVDAGLRLHALTGDDLRPEHWDLFFRFYRATSDRKWGWAYLSRAFFDELHARMRDKVLLVLAEQDGAFVAGALNVIGRDTLYGRNWGSDGRWPFLHFEACYYQAIEFAIAHGLKTVEAGAQGPHKIQRGYLPVATYSAHWLPERRFAEAVESYLARERLGVRRERAALAAQSPYRQGDDE